MRTQNQSPFKLPVEVVLRLKPAFEGMFLFAAQVKDDHFEKVLEFKGERMAGTGFNPLNGLRGIERTISGKLINPQSHLPMQIPVVPVRLEGRVYQISP